MRYSDEHCSWWTSRRESWCTGRRQQHGTLVHALLAIGIAGGEEEPPRGRPSARSGHVGLARPRARCRDPPASRPPRSPPRAHAGVPGARARPAAVPSRADRGAHRPRPPRSHAHVARHGEAARCRDALRGARALPAHALLRVRLETGRDASDPRAPRGDRPAGLGRPGLRGAHDVGLARQFLHAARLAFTHPVTGEPIDVESPLPPDLADALERARVG